MRNRFHQRVEGRVAAESQSPPFATPPREAVCRRFPCFCNQNPFRVDGLSAGPQDPADVTAICKSLCTMAGGAACSLPRIQFILAPLPSPTVSRATKNARSPDTAATKVLKFFLSTRRNTVLDTRAAQLAANGELITRYRTGSVARLQVYPVPHNHRPLSFTFFFF